MCWMGTVKGGSAVYRYTTYAYMYEVTHAILYLFICSLKNKYVKQTRDHSHLFHSAGSACLEARARDN